MLDDFGQRGAGSGGRLGASFVASAVIYGAIGGGVVFASAVARRAVVEDELVQVEFAPPPPPAPELPPPPPPPPDVAPPPAPARLGRPRPELEQPEEIPEERPEESDDALVPPGDPFAPEEEGDPNGIAGGQLGGTGSGAPQAVAPAPAPEPERPRGPVRVIEGSTPPSVDREEIARNFDIPAEVRSAGVARITVVVRVTIDVDGRVTRVDVLRGHALIPEANVVRAVERAHFTPARLADGTAYAAIHTFPITIAVTL